MPARPLQAIPPEPAVRRAHHLDGVRYEIRGPLARRAGELERQGYEIIKLNIGNPAQFGFRTPETMRLAIIENLAAVRGVLATRRASSPRGRRW